MSIGGGDAVVHCAKIGCGSDEVDVVIGIIVFLKLYGIKTESSK